MIHLGDITKIHGDKVEPVDCITFGSPCQDLSIAGRRAGLAGERSGLFMEAVRIIKEMRSSTNGLYPTFAIWENVPGAFSSNNGEDFRAVLEELARVEQPNVVIPGPPRGGRWSKAGAIAGNGWSLAWRQLDAQYWGVPQGRKRIALVVDFAGGRAGKILFERESVPGHPDQSIPTWKEIAGLAANRPAGNDRVVGTAIPINTQIATRCKALGERTGLGVGNENDPGYTLTAGHEHGVCYCISGNTVDRKTNQNGTGVKENIAFTVNTVDRNAVAYSLKIRSEPVLNDQGGNRIDVTYGVTGTLREAEHGHQPIVVCRGSGQSNAQTLENCSPTLTCQNDGPPIVFDARGNGNGKIVPTITGDHEGRVTDYTAVCCDVRHGKIEKGKSGTLQAKNDGGYSLNYINPVSIKRLRWIVRRLTPTECERLQGYPDGWTDIGEWVDSKGKKHKPADSPRYKALGNSIALPQWFWIAQKMKQYLPAGATLGSLFDGIGGFPLVWETTYGKGTARWASEIEEFPIAVTKKHFPERNEHEN